MPETEGVQRYAYDAQTDSILTILIHYCYPTKEVAIRELISNCSDALDKLRYLSITDHDLMKDDPDLKIRIFVDKENKQLHIIDTGIGMNKKELIKNLGTIANSGTKKFLEGIKKSDMDKVQQIGQFGIGFYSSFLIGDKVACISKSPSEDIAYKWESDGSSEYTITPMPDYPIVRGTHIIIDVKEGCEDYLNPTNLENIIKKHSGYVSYPIFLQVEKTKEVDDDEIEEEIKPESEEDKEDKTQDGEGSVEKVKDDETNKPKKKKTIHYQEDKQVNTEKKLWDIEPQSITDQDAERAYKHLSKGWSAPLMYKVSTVEGATNFSVAMFVHPQPKKEVFESKAGSGLVHAKIFCKGVFMTDCGKDKPLFTEHGLQSMLLVALDFNQAPYGISRDQFITPRFLKLVGKTCKNLFYKTIGQLKKDNPEKYAEFIKVYGLTLKLIVHEDAISGSKLLDHITFKNSMSEEEINLNQYVESMKEGQKKILFMIAADKKEFMANSTVQQLIKQEKNVLCFESPIDELMVHSIREVKGCQFQDIRKEGFVLHDDEESKKKLEEAKEEMKDFLAKFKTMAGSLISEVRLSNNMKEPLSITVPNYALSPQMEVMHQNQPMANSTMSFLNSSQKILLMNPDHHFISDLKAMVMSGRPEAEQIVKLTCNLAIFDSKYSLPDPKLFGEQVFKMLELALSTHPSLTGAKTSEESSSMSQNENNSPSDDAINKPVADSTLNEVD